MEWIQTTGKSTDEAVDQALEELGVDEDELEYEVVREAKSGLLGIGSQKAQVRARVRPISREKPDRRRRKRGGGRSKGSRQGKPDGGGRKGKGGGRGGRGRGSDSRRDGRGDGKEQRRGSDGGGGRAGKQRSGGAKQTAGAKQTPGQGRSRGSGDGEQRMSDVPVEEQAEVAQDFVRGLLDEFGLDGDVRVSTEEDRVVLEVEGEELGLLIGPDAGTMEALRELVKTTLQRHTAGQNARISIDIGGYAARRRAALEAFTRERAEVALEDGRVQVLEPMPPPDRKVVHDIVNEIDGVTTLSEGEEPRRRVVIEPES